MTLFPQGFVYFRLNHQFWNHFIKLLALNEFHQNPGIAYSPEFESDQYSSEFVHEIQAYIWEPAYCPYRFERNHEYMRILGNFKECPQYTKTDTQYGHVSCVLKQFGVQNNKQFA